MIIFSIFRAANGKFAEVGPKPDFPYVPKKQFKIIKIVPFSGLFH